MQSAQFGECADVRFRTAKAVIGTHHFTDVKPLRDHTALAQDLDKQQGRHQFAMADQLVGQSIGCRQRCGFCQRGDIFQQAIDLFADNLRIRQAINNVMLNAADGVQLHEAFGGFQAFSEGH